MDPGYICLSSARVVWLRSQVHKLAFPQLNFITFPWLHPLSPRPPQFWQCLQPHVRGKWPYDIPNFCITFSNKNTESKTDPKTRPELFFEELHQQPSFNLVLFLSPVTISHWTFLKISSLLPFFSILANRFPFGSILNNFNEIQIDRIYLWPRPFSLSRTFVHLIQDNWSRRIYLFFCFCQVLLRSELQICICWGHFSRFLKQTSILYHLWLDKAC